MSQQGSSKNYRRWTTEEDIRLLRHVLECGTGQWGSLRALGRLPHRDNKACCNRFILLKRKYLGISTDNDATSLENSLFSSVPTPGFPVTQSASTPFTANPSSSSAFPRQARQSPTQSTENAKQLAMSILEIIEKEEQQPSTSGPSTAAALPSPPTAALQPRTVATELMPVRAQQQNDGSQLAEVSNGRREGASLVQPPHTALKTEGSQASTLHKNLSSPRAQASQGNLPGTLRMELSDSDVWNSLLESQLASLLAANTHSSPKHSQTAASLANMASEEPSGLLHPTAVQLSACLGSMLNSPPDRSSVPRQHLPRMGTSIEQQHWGSFGASLSVQGGGGSRRTERDDGHKRMKPSPPGSNSELQASLGGEMGFGKSSLVLSEEDLDFGSDLGPGSSRTGVLVTDSAAQQLELQEALLCQFQEQLQRQGQQRQQQREFQESSEEQKLLLVLLLKHASSPEEQGKQHSQVLGHATDVMRRLSGSTESIQLQSPPLPPPAPLLPLASAASWPYEKVAKGGIQAGAGTPIRSSASAESHSLAFRPQLPSPRSKDTQSILNQDTTKRTSSRDPPSPLVSFVRTRSESHALPRPPPHLPSPRSEKGKQRHQGRRVVKKGGVPETSVLSDPISPYPIKSEPTIPISHGGLDYFSLRSGKGAMASSEREDPGWQELREEARQGYSRRFSEGGPGDAEWVHGAIESLSAPSSRTKGAMKGAGASCQDFSAARRPLRHQAPFRNETGQGSRTGIMRQGEVKEESLEASMVRVSPAEARVDNNRLKGALDAISTPSRGDALETGGEGLSIAALEAMLSAMHRVGSEGELHLDKGGVAGLRRTEGGSDMSGLQQVMDSFDSEVGRSAMGDILNEGMRVMDEVDFRPAQMENSLRRVATAELATDVVPRGTGVARLAGSCQEMESLGSFLHAAARCEEDAEHDGKAELLFEMMRIGAQRKSPTALSSRVKVDESQQEELDSLRPDIMLNNMW